MESLPLREILASLIKEFETAGVAADVSREHWRQVYESNALLKEFAPSRIRIREATVSIPLALTDVARPRSQSAQLTSMQVLRLLPRSLPLEQRTILADETAHYVSHTRRLTFANKQFTSTVGTYLKKRLAEVDEPPPTLEREVKETIAQLENLRTEFVSKVNANPEREASFAYRTEELAQLDASRLVRFDLKLELD